MGINLVKKNFLVMVLRSIKSYLGRRKSLTFQVDQLDYNWNEFLNVKKLITEEVTGKIQTSCVLLKLWFEMFQTKSYYHWSFTGYV